MEWISIKERLPSIDYSKKKPFVRVRIKINNNDDFSTVASFKESFTYGDDEELIPYGFYFYDREKKREYYGVTHWKPLEDDGKE